MESRICTGGMPARTSTGETPVPHLTGKMPVPHPLEPAHATHSTHASGRAVAAAAAHRLLVFLDLADDGVGRQQQAGDAGGVLQGDALDLGRDDARPSSSGRRIRR